MVSRTPSEALRKQPRGSERVLEVYSPLTLKVVRRPVFDTFTFSVPPQCPRG
jgi:hypothetical protein